MFHMVLYDSSDRFIQLLHDVFTLVRASVAIADGRG